MLAIAFLPAADPPIVQRREAELDGKVFIPRAGNAGGTQQVVSQTFCYACIGTVA
jgi:hypothetical protein